MGKIDDIMQQALHQAIEALPYTERPFLPDELAEMKRQAEWLLSQRIEQHYATDFVLRLINQVEALGKELHQMRRDLMEQANEQAAKRARKRGKTP